MEASHSSPDDIAHDYFNATNCTFYPPVQDDNPFGQLLKDTRPFLLPFTIEFSLICATIFFVMWRNIEEESAHYEEII